MRGTAAWCGVLLVALALAGCEDSSGGEDVRGKACEADSACGELVCGLDPEAEPEDLAQAPLVCVEPTEGGAPATECEEAADCDHRLCLLAGGCALPCADEDDCGPKERCAEVFARTAEDTLQALSACVRRSDLPDDAEVQVESRGDPLIEGENLIALEPDVPSGVRPLVILEHSDSAWPGERCSPPLCLLSLRTDAGDALFDASADYTQDEPPPLPVATAGHIDPLVLWLPSDDEAHASQRYFAALQTEQPGALTVTTVSRSARGQALDLHVFYVGQLALSPAGDRGPPVLAQALDEVDAILGQAGIFVGRVHQVAIGGELPMRGTYFPLGDGSMGFTVLQVRYGTHVELPGLFRLSAGAPGGGVNLFLLDDIEPRMLDAEPFAEAGGIPGPPAMHGTGGSGIAFAASMMVGDPAAFGRTLAHELAHYLGLFHTSEQDGRVLDELDDTAECRLERDVDRDGLEPAECAEHGLDNLMFWATTTSTVLTEQQRARLARSPILR